MTHPNWQRKVLLGALLLATLFPAGAAFAAPAAIPAQSRDFSSCLQRVKEDLGTVLPGSAFANSIRQCPLSGVADRGIIPVTGSVNSSSWRDAGASAGFAHSDGWHDAGAGSR
jgi:hypothetical protein